MLVWLTVLVLHGLALSILLAHAPSRSKHAPPGRRMQLFWIPSGSVSPQHAPVAATTDEALAADADAGVAPTRTATAPRTADGPRAEDPSPSVRVGRPGDAPVRRGPATPDIRQLPGIDALLRQVPTLAQPVPLHKDVTRFDGGRGQIQLPGSDATLVPGLVVRDPVSLDQRVQGVLALVGLGRTDPCPDIRRHVRSAMEAQDPDELSYWVDREQRCR